MKLSTLLTNITVLKHVGSLEHEVVELSQDTRSLERKGSLYFAIPGTVVDGHDYIQEAISSGARTIVCSILPRELNKEVTYVLLEDVARQVGNIASTFYGNPSQNLTVIGVTGTNGKTSVASSFFYVLQQLGYTVSLMSTINNHIGDRVVEADKTTGSPIDIQKFMKDAVDSGCSHFVMEVSSHALSQHRVTGIDFNLGIFTNLTQDHLDYHKTMENYASEKKKFFQLLSKEAIAITNSDDKYGKYMVDDTEAVVYRYGTTMDADYHLEIQNITPEGTQFSINRVDMKIPLIGRFNAYNLCAVYAGLCELGFDSDELVTIFSTLSGVPGRIEALSQSTGIHAFVDYAHTPDALQNVLSTLSELPHGKMITVFGCGGDRDRKKRAPMASIAETYNDIVIVTDDNPRTEDRERIFADIKEGFVASPQKYELVPGREEAIARAVELSEKGDILLVAGKGHEDYQIIGTEKKHFSDHEVLYKYLNR